MNNPEHEILRASSIAQDKHYKSEIASLKAEHKECVDAVREESIAIGKLDKIKYDNAHNELLKYAIIFNVKQRIKHSRSGMTWDQFLDRIGEAKNTVDKTLKDIRPIVENFSESFTAFSNIPFNKIRYLGRSFDSGATAVDDGEIIIDGARIALSPDSKDDIEAAIDAMKEANAKEKTKLLDKLQREKAKKEDAGNELIRGLRAEIKCYEQELSELRPYKPNHDWGLDEIKDIEKKAGELDSAIRRLTTKHLDKITEDLHV